MLRTLILLLFSGLVSYFPNQTSTLPRLKVSDNHRFLVAEDGKPFFYLGDTAWELFHRCNREEADMYLRKRAEQGFNVVQAVALAELDGLNTPNPYGATPLTNNDPTKPNEKYFQHVDYIIQRAAHHRIYIALSWAHLGEINYKETFWEQAREIFTPENAQIFGKWIGARYKNQTNIIWVWGR
ncbi:MAG: DUF4038 domain-containing protein [Bacteroidia bacterium]